jgi:hypothetical protein
MTAQRGDHAYETWTLVSFDDERWKLHTALAWIMTRDREYTERCLALSYYPCLTIGEFPPASDVNESRKLLFSALSDGVFQFSGIQPKYGKARRFNCPRATFEVLIGQIHPNSKARNPCQA